MKLSRIAQFRAGSAPLVLGVALLAAPAFAQDTTSDATTDSANPDIVVTGSLISNPNLEQASPVNVIGQEQMELRQANVAEQLLRELPGVTPSIGSAVNNGNGGSSFVDLRNLGSNRNVVLLDGARLTPAELQGRFDLNNVPLALIERVDVLTGGSSTTYGADAVAGVVNFVTRRNFSGVEINASNQITERGDGNTFRVDATVGANLDDGRGNVVLSIGYQESDAVYQGARDFGRFAISSTSGAGGGSGTSIPTRFSLGSIGTRQVNAAGTAFNPTSAYTAYNFNPFNIYQTPFERFNIYGAANYQISDAVEIYTRALFSKNTVSTIVAPSGVFGSPVTLNLNNPFLTDALRTSFCDGNGISAADCVAAANPNLRPGDAAYREVATNLSRRTEETGPRQSDYSTTYFDYRLGFRGGITDSIRWDVFGSYGQSENIQRTSGYVLTSRATQSVLATSTTECLDPSNGCVPVNWFGPQGNASFTDAARDFLTESSSIAVKMTMAQARATISGDFGVAVPMANDPISFAVGGEYRQYTATQASDTLAQGGDLGGFGGAAPNINGGFDVYEAFGELVMPIVQDRPFFHDLTLEAGIRYSSYNVDSPLSPGYNTTTWKVAGSWAPVEDIRFRANYARAVRAPNIEELFGPYNTLLTNLGDEPCATLNDDGETFRPTPTGTLRAICLAQGAPASSIGSIGVPTAGQVNYTGGGNLQLRPEVARTWTVGAVFEPRFAPGLSLSVDYYHIKITKAISAPTPDDAIQACFGAPTGVDADGNNIWSPAAGAENSVACTVIRRDPLTGGLSGDQNTVPGLYLPTTNSGTLETSGIDVSLGYRRDLGFAELNLAGQLNWTEQSKFQAIPGAINRDCVGYYSSNCGQPIPEWQWSLRTTLAFSSFDLSLLWRHIGGTEYEPGLGELYEGQLKPSTGDVAGQSVNFNRIKATDYFDLTARVPVSDNLTLTLAVQNLFDKDPPLVGGEAGSTTYNSGNTFPSTYDTLGRRYTASVRLRF